MRTTPLRLTTLHFGQRFLTDAATFIIHLTIYTQKSDSPVGEPVLLNTLCLNTAFEDLKPRKHFRLTIRHCNRVLKMGREFTIFC